MIYLNQDVLEMKQHNKKNRLQLLDYARFFAAIFVVLYHYTFNGIVNGKISSITHINELAEITKYGYLGVELFFMISGYVIFFSAQKSSASKFAIGRAIRLYPAYWFAVLFTASFAAFWGGDLMSVNFIQTLVNLTMFQKFLTFDHVDGVYWTLVYEITFYAAVFILILFGLQKRILSIFTYWPIVFCMALLLDLQNIPFLGSYYYYFAAGALFAALKQKFSFRVLISLIVTYLLCVFFSSGKAEVLTISKGFEHSSIVIAMLVTLFFLLFTFQNTTLGGALKLPFSRLAGALTYPVYLIHAHFGYMFVSQFATDENKLFIYALCILIVLLLALFIHKAIEVKFSNIWKNIFDKVLRRPIDSLSNKLNKITSL